MLKVNNILNIEPQDVKNCLLVKEGDSVKKGDKIAETPGLFGMFKSAVDSPVDGTIESISDTTGRVVFEGSPMPVEVDAYVSGEVGEVIENEGIVVNSKASFIQKGYLVLQEKNKVI